jgi:hypothetical protein
MRVAFPVPIASADSSPDFTARAVTHCQYSPLLSFSKLFVILVGLLPGAAPETKRLPEFSTEVLKTLWKFPFSVC